MILPLSVRTQCGLVGSMALLSITLSAFAAKLPYPVHGDNRVKFPAVPGYVTLKCDFHIHTVFSDGKVWPNMRVEEALREGLDVIAMTEHLEWNPHRKDIPFPDQNRSYEIALEAAKDRDLMVFNAAEITRRLPPEGDEPGHLNAIFLKDANLLKKPDHTDVLREARKQDAFVIWNHPSWLRQTPDGVARVLPLHEKLFAENLIHGVEVINQSDYSEEALQIALERNLAIIGASDIHAPIDWFYPSPDAKHRPMTFVFAKEKTEASLKEALFAGRTTVWWRNNLIGRKEWLVPLLQASLTARSHGYEWETAPFGYLPKTTVLNVELVNSSDAEFILRNVSGYNLHNELDVFTVKPHGTAMLQVKLMQKLARAVLKFEVLNTLVAPKQHAVVEFTVNRQPDAEAAIVPTREP